MNFEIILTSLERLADGFNKHDPDAILRHFADDAVMELPVGNNPYGQRYVGKTEIRTGIEARFAGMPDVQWENVHHVVAGYTGLSTWTITGTCDDGSTLRLNGCDIYTFRNGQVIKKDSYWKTPVQVDLSMHVGDQP